MAPEQAFEQATPWLSGHWKPVRVGCYERNYGPWAGCKEPVPLRLKKPHGMFGLRVWWLHARRAYIKWAMHDMGVLHRDYPEAVHELHVIDDELARRGAA